MKRILVLESEDEYQKLLRVLDMSSEELMLTLKCDVDLNENIVKFPQRKDMFINMKMFFEGEQ